MAAKDGKATFEPTIDITDCPTCHRPFDDIPMTFRSWWTRRRATMLWFGGMLMALAVAVSLSGAIHDAATNVDDVWVILYRTGQALGFVVGAALALVALLPPARR